MVVVSGTWVKNVAPYSPQIVADITVMDLDNMAPRAILICRQNSHYFQDRNLNLLQSIKVGRSVARAKPTSTNAIFDCKVLSRHHALLWYENGCFYLQDTKSSNGTFVNNNKLGVEKYRVHSGDIVQFGVDVVENNRKVTHGCIIATLRLFFPDGIEEKASPCIMEGESHGVVPLDDLYKLNQILQEANQRERCLESKLNTLQNIVEDTKRSAEESWQAYVGEERLLSRLSALETQLQQARTNWNEDRQKEEIVKLRENNEKYQEAAKEALEKVHDEKQQAIVLAMEQERAKTSAEQDALLAREQIDVAQLQIQEMAQKITELRDKADEEKLEHEKQVRELEQQTEAEEAKIIELEAKIYELTLEVSRKHSFSDRPDLILDDVKIKEEIIAENELADHNGFQNHITFTVAPVSAVEEKNEYPESESTAKDQGRESEDKLKDYVKRVSFNVSEHGDLTDDSFKDDHNSPRNEDDGEKDYPIDYVESKTLKYQFHSAQREKIELKRKIEVLERNSETNRTKIMELNKALCDEKELSGERLTACENLKEELINLGDQGREIRFENKKLIERVNELVDQLGRNSTIDSIGEDEDEKEEIVSHSKIDELTESVLSDPSQSLTISNPNFLSNEQLMNMEEELVLLKEKYAQSCDDKVKLQRDLQKIKYQYDMVCNNMYNRYFWYVGPLVVIVFYLLIREWIS